MMETIQRSEENQSNDPCLSLVKGVDHLFVLPLLNIEKQLHELRKKQLILIEQLHNENLKLAWSHNSAELQEIYTTLKLYDVKLTNLKRTMKLLHERIVKIKKRVTRLLQFQKTQIYIESQQRQDQ